MVDPDDAPVLVDFMPTDEHPWMGRDSALPTFEGNLIAQVVPEGSTASHQFLIGMRGDGWYVTLPTPFHDDTFPEEWAYDWIGPYLTRQDAIDHLPQALCRYIEACFEHLQELTSHTEWMADHPEQWTTCAPAHRIRPKLHSIL